MKREEAIKILQPIGEQYCEIANITLAQRMDEIAEAIDMAIDALEAQLSQQGTTSDLISRQAAIDAIHNLYAIHGSEGSWIDQKDAFKALNNLPSAQPEPLTDKEQRIFLAAMGREEKVCKQVDEEWRDCREPYEDSLVSVCNEIERKVKGALWTI